MIDDILGVKHHFSDGLYAKESFIPKGALLTQHKHTYSHLSILAKGSVIVKVDENIQEYVAPACIEIKDNKNHSVFALEDCVWYCIHATEETDVNNIDSVLIAKGE